MISDAMTFSDLVCVYGEERALRTLENMENAVLSQEMLIWAEQRQRSLEERVAWVMDRLVEVNFAA